MGRIIFVLALLICIVVHEGTCRSIDETILLAEQESSASDMPSSIVKVELDMLFDADEYAQMQRQDTESQQRRKKRKALRPESRRWTNNVIPYRIEDGLFSQADLAQFEAAVNDWNRYTCLNFRPYRNGDSNYINIENGPGCASIVGMKGGSQPLWLARNCRTKRVIIHELGHVLGFYHEHSRPDRDQHVEIIPANIQSGSENFRRYSTNVINNYGVPYDYLSIMHYGKTAFGLNRAQTIRTIDAAYQDIIGNTHTLSFRDIKLVNLMYNCGIHGYNMTTNRNRGGGVHHATNTSLEQCAALCMTDTDCAAFDYDRSSQCWIHNRVRECRAAFPIYSNTLWDHYVKSCACANYEPPTFSGYTFVDRLSKARGREVANRPSEALCIESCSEDATCQSIDFNFKNNKCYKHTRTTGCRTGITHKNVHRYTRNTVTC